MEAEHACTSGFSKNPECMHVSKIRGDVPIIRSVVNETIVKKPTRFGYVSWSQFPCLRFTKIMGSRSIAITRLP